MKIFRVSMKDSLDWVYQGHVSTEVHIQADSMVGALAYAEDAADALREKLAANGRLDARDSLRITEIHEISEFLDAMAETRAEQIEDWAARKAAITQRER